MLSSSAVNKIRILGERVGHDEGAEVGHINVHSTFMHFLLVVGNSFFERTVYFESVIHVVFFVLIEGSSISTTTSE